MFAEKENSKKYDLLLDHPLRGYFEATNKCNIAELVRQYKYSCKREFWADRIQVIGPTILFVCFIVSIFAVHPYLKNEQQRIGTTLVLFLVFQAIGQVLLWYVKKKISGVPAPDVSRLDDFRKNLPSLTWSDCVNVNGEEDFELILVHIAKKILNGEQEFNELCGLQSPSSDKSDAIIFVGLDVRKNRAKYHNIEASANTFGFFIDQGEIFSAARRQIADMRNSAL